MDQEAEDIRGGANNGSVNVEKREEKILRQFFSREDASYRSYPFSLGGLGSLGRVGGAGQHMQVSCH